MDDLISRAAAIEAAIDGADDWDGGYNLERERCIREHMAKVPAVDAVPVVQRWISVNDRFPDKPCNYLIHVPPVYTYVVFYNGYDWVVDEDEFCFDAYEITHWMPLPEPPKMDGDANG